MATIVPVVKGLPEDGFDDAADFGVEVDNVQKPGEVNVTCRAVFCCIFSLLAVQVAGPRRLAISAAMPSKNCNICGRNCGSSRNAFGGVPSFVN